MAAADYNLLVEGVAPTAWHIDDFFTSLPPGMHAADKFTLGFYADDRIEGIAEVVRGWNAPQTGPMEGANQALSDIVFRRDRRLFEAAFPNFQVVEEGIDPSWFRYLASGGLNFRRIAPRWAFSVARRFENRLEHLHRWFGIHHYIVLRNNHPRTNP